MVEESVVEWVVMMADRWGHCLVGAMVVQRVDLRVEKWEHSMAVALAQKMVAHLESNLVELTENWRAASKAESWVEWLVHWTVEMRATESAALLAESLVALSAEK